MRDTDTDSSAVDAEGRITLGLLRAVYDNASTSQRSIARELGIALGLTNAYLKRCVRKGLIKVKQAPANRYAYYLTPKGFAEKSRLTAEYLFQSFKFFRAARSQGMKLFQQCEARGWTRIALYGVGDFVEILTLCANEFRVEIVGIVDSTPGLPHSVGLPVAARASDLGSIDAVIVCDLADSQAAFERACAEVGAERVLAPPFMHISSNPPAAGEQSP